MGFFEISALAAAVFNTGLALLVVRRDLTSLLHRAYIGWAICADDLERRGAGARPADDHEGAALLGEDPAIGGDLHARSRCCTSA